MRSLICLRGAPGAGKSSWIQNNNLENYTLSPDTIRVMCASTELLADGSLAITQDRENEKQVWDILFKLLEHRMSRGELTVIDATCSKTADIQRYKDLAESYRYRIYCVDFTDVPLETCLAQNRMRPTWKWVPEDAIKNIYARFATQKIPGGVTVIKPWEFKTIYEQPIDLSNYKRVVIFGDIHGCYDTLKQYPDFIDGGRSLDPETCYIFCGDYFDRGNQNGEIAWFMYSLKDYKNVCLLEGNHERHLYHYGHGAPAKSREFEKNTKPQLIAKNFTEKHARELYRKLRQFSHFTFHGKEVLACHGGVPSLTAYDNLIYLPTESFVKGCGNYGDYERVAETWMGCTTENQYLVHGHRNVEDSPLQIADRVYNLEGSVEYGGAIRVVEFYADGPNTIMELPCMQAEDIVLIEPSAEAKSVETVEDAVKYLRANKFVNEKPVGGTVSAFNFTRDAFYKGNWTKQTILARGLFIDTAKNEIVARSYEKFFRVDEQPTTELRALASSLVFPVKAFKKENGFLAIVAWDKTKEDLFIASKSSISGEHTNYIKAAMTPEQRTAIADYLKNNDSMTLVFECIDPVNDPHIIKYDKAKLVLLDVIYNELTFNKVPYNELCTIAEKLGVEVKECSYVLKDWEAFRELYNDTLAEDYQLNGEYIEGYVFEDANGFMVKVKSGYYQLWKKLRGVADQTLRCGYITRTGMLTSAIENYFYGFCRERFNTDRDATTKSYPYAIDIISMRERFFASR